MTRQALAHVRSARALADTDPHGAIALCHDAARKAIDAHACTNGYRFENTSGAHRHAIDYGRNALVALLTEGALDELDRLRNVRHASEYGTQPVKIDADEVVRFSAVAENVVTAVIGAIAPPPPG